MPRSLRCHGARLGDSRGRRRAPGDEILDTLIAATHHPVTTTRLDGFTRLLRPISAARESLHGATVNPLSRWPRRSASGPWARGCPLESRIRGHGQPLGKQLLAQSVPTTRLAEKAPSLVGGSGAYPTDQQPEQTRHRRRLQEGHIRRSHLGIGVRIRGIGDRIDRRRASAIRQRRARGKAAEKGTSPDRTSSQATP
jgi:hypothetical protein